MGFVRGVRFSVIWVDVWYFNSDRFSKGIRKIENVTKSSSDSFLFFNLRHKKFRWFERSISNRGKLQ